MEQRAQLLELVPRAGRDEQPAVGAGGRERTVDRAAYRLPLGAGGRGRAAPRDRLRLEREQLRDAPVGELQQPVHLLAMERLALRGPLDLDVRARVRGDHVEVDLRARILRVVEVQQQRALHDAHAHRAQVPPERPLEARAPERDGERDPATGDRGAARAAVRLEHVAVDGHGPLAQDRRVHHAPQRPPDEPLDLVRPAAQLALDRLALAALRGGARQHRVLRGHPADALAAQVRRDAVLDGRRAQDMRAAARG